MMTKNKPSTPASTAEQGEFSSNCWTGLFEQVVRRKQCEARTNRSREIESRHEVTPASKGSGDECSNRGLIDSVPETVSGPSLMSTSKIFHSAQCQISLLNQIFFTFEASEGKVSTHSYSRKRTLGVRGRFLC